MITWTVRGGEPHTQSKHWNFQVSRNEDDKEFKWDLEIWSTYDDSYILIPFQTKRGAQRFIEERESHWWPDGHS